MKHKILFWLLDLICEALTRDEYTRKEIREASVSPMPARDDYVLQRKDNPNRPVNGHAFVVSGLDVVLGIDSAILRLRVVSEILRRNKDGETD